MKDSWRGLFRRLAATSFVCSSMAWSSAMCYAAQLAFDSASDTVYADGWQAGDNGGTGFLPWNFDNDPGAVGTHTVDSTSPFNDLGTAWRIAVDPDLTRAGRGFAHLQPGQTLRMVIDNPAENQFFKGYIIRLNSGGGNICYGGSPCTDGSPSDTWMPVISLSPSFWKPAVPSSPESIVDEASRPSARMRTGVLAGFE